MAGLIEVAKLAGVGKSTVSRYINGNGAVSEEAKIKIEAAIKELNYSPNQMARNLKMRRSNIIALFVPVINHPYFSAFASCVEEELYKRNIRMIVVDSQLQKEKEIELLSMISQSIVDGGIFLTHHYYESLDENLPIVTVDRHFGKKIPCITSDNYDATKAAIEYLIAKGSSKIGFIGGQALVKSEVTKRLDAYLDVMKQHNLRPYVSNEIFSHGEESVVAKRFLDENSDFDALFVSGDLLAMEVYNYLKDKGKKVPEDIKIICYDGVLNSAYRPHFTACKQNLKEMAALAVDQLIRKIEHKECDVVKVVPCEFVVGETA